MFLEALLIGVIAGIGILDGRIFGDLMIGRPIVLGPLVGLVLGDLQMGIVVGGTLELIWMGIVGVGSATPPDIATGGVLGTAFAIITGKGAEVALALAVPVAILAQSLGVLVRIVNAWFLHRADRYAEDGDAAGVSRMHLTPIALFFLSTAVPSFLAVYFGADAVKTVIEAVPVPILNGLKVAGGLLPALGFAMLLQIMSAAYLLPFFFIGFVLAVFLKLNIIAAAVIGLMAAIVYTQLKAVREE